MMILDSVSYSKKSITQFMWIEICVTLEIF